MRKNFIILIFTALFIFSTTLFIHAKESAISKVSFQKKKVEQYKLIELDIELTLSYKNPHNPKKINLEAHIKDPEGKNVTMPGFLFSSDGVWKIRFTPTKVGRHTLYITLKTPQGLDKSETYQFNVKKGKGNGFIRKNKLNPYYPIFDSGKTFFGIGHALGWVSENNLTTYEEYFKLLNENDCNITRTWLNSEWTPKIEIRRIGKYDLEDSKIVDEVLVLAEKYGIYLILVFDTYGTLMDERGPWGEERWRVNPYNKRKGGPCEKPWDFFSNEEAKKHYKNRLRYMIARWSYSPNILAFELWNELDSPAGWTKEMFSYIKRINPHGQLVTASLSFPWDNCFDDSKIWSLKELDIIQLHIYGDKSKHIIGYLISKNKKLVKEHKKMILIGEFGMDGSKHDKKCDPEGCGVALHNSIWASSFSGSFSSALNWWWTGYVKSNNLYFNYRALRKFIKDVNWNSKKVAFAETTPIKVKLSPKEKLVYKDIILQTADDWGKVDFDKFTVENNGALSGGVINAFLHGTSKKKIRLEPIFYLDYPRDGKFILDIGTVSQGATLIAYLDGKKIFSKNFPAGSGDGPWKKSLYLKKYKVYQCIYDTKIEIDIPRGKHTLKLTNTGKDWIGIKRITLENYTSNLFANARASGIVLDREIIFWIQNKEFNWRSVKMGKKPSLIKGAYFKLLNIENSDYKIEWWDTFKGKITSCDNATSENNQLLVKVPPFSKDIACKIKHSQ